MASPSQRPLLNLSVWSWDIIHEVKFVTMHVTYTSDKALHDCAYLALLVVNNCFEQGSTPSYNCKLKYYTSK